MKICFLVFLAGLVPSPFASVSAFGSLFRPVLSLACLARGLDRCPRAVFSCFSRGTLVRARKLVHFSQSVPLGHRDAKRWIVASGAYDQGSEEQEFPNEFLQFLDTSQAKEAPPGTGRCAPHEAKTTSSVSS